LALPHWPSTFPLSPIFLCPNYLPSMRFSWYRSLCLIFNFCSHFYCAILFFILSWLLILFQGCKVHSDLTKEFSSPLLSYYFFVGFYPLC
jgi:hypothetical protein